MPDKKTYVPGLIVHRTKVDRLTSGMLEIHKPRCGYLWPEYFRHCAVDVLDWFSKHLARLVRWLRLRVWGWRL